MGVEDVARAYTLFLDVQRSVQYLQEYAQQYMYNELDEGGGGGGGEEEAAVDEGEGEEGAAMQQ